MLVRGLGPTSMTALLVQHGKGDGVETITDEATAQAAFEAVFGPRDDLPPARA